MFTFKHLHFVRIQERLFQLQYHAPDGRAHTFRDVGQSDKTDGERKTVPGGTLPQNFQVNVVNGNTPQFQRIFRIEKGDRHRGNNTDHIGMREIFAEFRSAHGGQVVLSDDPLDFPPFKELDIFMLR